MSIPQCSVCLERYCLNLGGDNGSVYGSKPNAIEKAETGKQACNQRNLTRVIGNQSLMSDSDLENNYTSLQETRRRSGVDKVLFLSDSHLAQVYSFEMSELINRPSTPSIKDVTPPSRIKRNIVFRWQMLYIQHCYCLMFVMC